MPERNIDRRGFTTHTASANEGVVTGQLMPKTAREVAR
jgi:hypothetical protein